MKYIVNILNDNYDAIKTFDGFDTQASAIKFARQETEWRGCAAEVVLTDNGSHTFGYTFIPKIKKYH